MKFSHYVFLSSHLFRFPNNALIKRIIKYYDYCAYYLINSLGELTRIVIFYVKEITPTR